MDAWQRTFNQLRTVFRGLSTAQRVSVLVVTLGVLAGMGWLAWSAADSPDEFLLGGKSFTADELTQTQAALKGAGLTEFRVVGQRISVPAREVDRYTAAAIARQTLPAQFAAEFDRMQSKVNLFTSSEQRRELLEEARKSRLAQILCAIPEIEEAIVEWDRPRSANLFRPAPQVAAHVSVKPRGGRPLSPELVQSLKLFVAGALAGAQPDDVTVVDLNTSRVHGRRSATDVASERVSGAAKQEEAEYAARMTHALRYIPDVLVSVNVELIADRVEEDAPGAFINSEIVPVSRRRENRAASGQSRSNHPASLRIDLPTVTQTTLMSDRPFDPHREPAALHRPPVAADEAADTPDSEEYQKSVQVAVSIPEDYFAAVARQRGFSPGQSLVEDSAHRANLAHIKSETQRDVREQLVRLLPRGSDPAAISVTTYTPLNDAAGRQDSKQKASFELPFGIDFQTWKVGTGVTICSVCLLFGLLWLRPRRLHVPVRAESDATQMETDAATQPTGDIVEPENEYPELRPHPHASLLAELAELERRTVSPAVHQPAPFAFLSDLTVSAAARLMETEHPQTIALIATALEPVDAAEILHALPESLRWEVTQRLARIAPATPDVLREVASSLRSRLSLEPLASREPHGETLQPAAGSVPSEEGLTSAGLAPIEASPASPFHFEDLQALDVRSLRTVIEAVDPRSCAVAFLDRSESLKHALLSSLPKHLATAIRQHLRQLGPIRLTEISAAQAAIADLAWSLSAQGAITLPAHLQETGR